MQVAAIETPHKATQQFAAQDAVANLLNTREDHAEPQLRPCLSGHADYTYFDPSHLALETKLKRP